MCSKIRCLILYIILIYVLQLVCNYVYLINIAFYKRHDNITATDVR